MRIKVRAFGDLARALGKDLEMELPSDADVGELLARIGAQTGKTSPDGEPKPNLVVLVEGLNIQFLDKLRTRLNDGDVVSILPPAGGG
jgi:molybdopterin synthase sulfur carrier subunit